jgi:hypothetical protein
LAFKIFLLSGLLIGCASAPRQTQRPIVNLESEFHEFWRQSRYENFDAQLKNWDQIVEGPHQDLFDVMVNNKKYDSSWREHRVERLRERFAYFRQHYDEVEDQFIEFDGNLEKQLSRFDQKFPMMHIKLPIYAIPGATFNGKLGSVNSKGDLGLAFGPDMMIILKNNPDVLYAHELFQLYHVQKMGLTAEYYETKALFTLPLWIEGLGTYVSELLNPTAPRTDILMQTDLANLDVAADRNPKLLEKMAADYLTIADKKLGEADPQYVQRRAWFGAATANVDRPQKTAQRIGYLLGLRIARVLSHQYSLQEMSGWSPEEAHKHVKMELEKIAHPRYFLTTAQPPISTK